MKSKLLLNKFHATLAAGLLTASIVVAPSTQASDWAGTNGNWSSNGSPGWNGTGVPNAVGAVANHGNANASTTTQDVALGVTVGTISLTNNSNHQWNFTLANGITLDQDGAGSGNATISNTNTNAGTSNGVVFNSGTLTLADNLLISNTGSSTRTAVNGGSISFSSSSVIAGTGKNITIDNVLNDTVAGVGAITFRGGSNTFTGNVNVRSGGTIFNGTSAFGNAANVITLGASGAGSASLLANASATLVNNWVVAAGSGGTLTLGSISTTTQTWSGTGTLNGDLTLSTLADSANKFRLNGVISGTGNFTMSSSGAGYAEMSQANTYSGSTKVSSGILSLTNANALQNSALDTTGSVIGTATAGLRAGVTTLTLGGLTGNKNLADVFATGAGASAGQYSTVTALTLNLGTGVTHTYSAGIANGAGVTTLTKTGNGIQTLSGSNSYTGATTVSAGTLLISSGGSLAAGSAVTVQTGAAIGGDGTINGNLTLNSGAKFVFDINDNPLTVAGTFALASGFGVDDLVTSSLGAIDWSSVGLGTYTLIGTSFSFNSGNIDNFGLGNALSSGGKLVYFENGSLDLVVAAIPEPSTWALLGLGLTTVMVFRRRRQS